MDGVRTAAGASVSRRAKIVPMRIVVAVDPVRGPEVVANSAVALARAEGGAELMFCHAIDLQRLLTGADRYADDYAVAFQAARREALSVLDRCVTLATQAGIGARASLRFGKAAGEVGAAAASFAADLVVIGNSRSGRVHRMLCGSVCDDILRASEVPVVVVPSAKVPDNQSGRRQDEGRNEQIDQLRRGDAARDRRADRTADQAAQR